MNKNDIYTEIYEAQTKGSGDFDAKGDVMPGPMGGGRRRQMGAKPKVKNPGKILGRILGYTFKNYKIHMIIVFICIIVSVLANVQGTLFIQSLIDDYITPLMNTSSPDFTPCFSQ